MNTETRVTAVRGEGVEGWVIRVKGLSKEKKKDSWLMDTDNNVVITREKGDGGMYLSIKGDKWWWKET